MRKSEFDMSMPLFFKLWFAFVAILAVSIIVASVWFGAALLTNPQIVGQWVGGVVTGFQEVSK